VFKNEYIEKLLIVFNISMVLNFFNVSMPKFDIFGQKGRKHFHFLTYIIFTFKNRKHDIKLNICLCIMEKYLLAENIDNI